MGNSNEDLVNYTIQSNSLSYSTLRNYRNKLVGSSYGAAGRSLDVSATGLFAAYSHPDSTFIGSRRNTTLWFSFLITKLTSSTEVPVAIGLHNNNTPWCIGCESSNKLEIGYFGTDSHVSGQQRWGLRADGRSVINSSVPIVNGNTYFMVVKLEFNQNNTLVSLYVNPTSLGATIPSVPTLTYTTPTPLKIRGISTQYGIGAGAEFDEFRFSNTYQCVAPDNNTTINLPPRADLALSTYSGSGPLNVTLNGSSSIDPEGGPLTYRWSLGDGSPLVSGSMSTLNHTYSEYTTGQLRVSLTITDNTNQSSSTNKTLTLLDENNTFSCLTTITSLNQVSCGNNDGRIRVNATNGTLFALRNSANALMPISSGNQYHNLAPGNYNLYVNNSNGCRDTFRIVMNVDSNTCSGWTSPCGTEMGINLSTANDWTAERAFRNLFKLARPFIAYHDGGPWDNGAANQISTDNQGYPLQIPQSTTASNQTKVRYSISSAGGALVNGQSYVLLYDGEGTLQLNGMSSITNSRPGRIQFVAANDNHWFNLTASQSGNHVRNIRIVRLSDEPNIATLDTEPFYSVFLEKLDAFSKLRFLNWHENFVEPHLSSWTNRSKKDYYTWATNQGVPYEVMIDLANKTNKDVWICVPYLADDDFIAQMATLFKNNLDPRLKVYLEYSNEVWNWNFPQAGYNDRTKASNLSYGQGYAEKARRLFRIWTSVFGAEMPTRVNRVLGLQQSNNGLNEQIMAYLDQDEWDVASPSSYFDLGENPPLNSSSTAADVIAQARNYFRNTKQHTIKQDLDNIRMLGKRIETYEGGQHFSQYQLTSYQEAMYDAQIHPDMYHLYNEVLTHFKKHGCKTQMMYNFVSQRRSVSGSWGHLEDIDVQPPYMLVAPKFQALLDNVCYPVTRMGSIPNTTVCAGSEFSVPFTVPYGSALNNNIYRAYLQDVSGNDILIGSLTSTSSSGTINATIPPTLNTGDYRLRITSSNPATNRSTRNITIRVNALPNPQTSGVLAICSGQSTTLSATGGVSYRWLPGNQTGNTLLVTAQGTYSLEATNAQGCKKTTSADVTVSSLPTASIAGVLAICSGQSTSLTASGGVTYRWSNGSTTSVITVSIAAISTVTVTNAEGCVNTASVSVTVGSLPTAFISGTKQVCAGSTTTLTASGGVSYVWQDGSTATTITVSPPLAVSLTAINASGCRHNTSVNTTAFALPNPIISASGPTSYCAGNSTTLSVTNVSNITGYLWSNNATNASITTDPNNTTSYAVGVRDVNGCIGVSQPVTVTVNPLPTAFISGMLAICSGQSTSLTASGGVTYRWSNGSTNNVILVSTPGINTVTVTSAAGCVNTASVSITVGSLPTAVISGTTQVCAGSTTTLTANGGVSYVWQDGSTATTIAVTPPLAVSLTAINASGCRHTTSVNTTTYALPSPIISASGPTSYCQGRYVTLSVTNVSNIIEYLWSTYEVTPSIPTYKNNSSSYTVGVRDVNHCIGISAPLHVEVNPLPTASITGVLAICSGQSTSLTANGGSIYHWSNGSNERTITISTPGINTLTVTSINGCVNTASVSVNVGSLPTAIISGITQVCEGSATTLTANGGFRYEWSTGEVSRIINRSLQGEVRLTAYDNAGCFNTASTNITVNPLPLINASGNNSMCIGDSLLINASGADEYFWSPAEYLNTSYGAIIIAKPISDVIYTILGRSNKGCEATHLHPINLINCNNRSLLTIEEVEGRVNIFPNPFKENVSVSFSLLTETSPIAIRFYNSLGQLVSVPFKEKIKTGERSVSFSTELLPAGIYMIVVESNNKIVLTNKLIKQ